MIENQPKIKHFSILHIPLSLCIHYLCTFMNISANSLYFLSLTRCFFVTTRRQALFKKGSLSARQKTAKRQESVEILHQSKDSG